MTLRLKFLSVDVDRHGNKRIYFRRRGSPKIRITAEPGTPEFMSEYTAALSGQLPVMAPRPKPEEKAPSKSLRWLIQRYIADCPEWKKLEPRTRTLRRRALDNLCDEPISDTDADPVGHQPFAAFKPAQFIKLRDRLAETPEMANGRIKAVRQVYAWAVKENHVDFNPAREVPYIKTGSQGFYTWTRGDVAQYCDFHEVGSKARLALALLLFLGVRRSDLVRLGKQHIRKPEQMSPMLREKWPGRWIEFKVFKGRKKKLVTLSLPIIPPLERALLDGPLGKLTFLETEFGKPYTSNGFGNWFRRRCREAKLELCSAHGLRKAGATIAAENGASTRTLMAIFGWSSAKQAELYTRAVDQKVLAGQGMQLLMDDAAVEQKKISNDR